jgi:uridine kinase
LLTYALGRELDARDQPAIRQIMRETEARGYRFQDVIAAIVNSVPFQMRQSQPERSNAS